MTLFKIWIRSQSPGPQTNLNISQEKSIFAHIIRQIVHDCVQWHLPTCTSFALDEESIKNLLAHKVKLHPRMPLLFHIFISWWLCILFVWKDTTGRVSCAVNIRHRSMQQTEYTYLIHRLIFFLRKLPTHSSTRCSKIKSVLLMNIFLMYNCIVRWIVL